MKKNVRTGGRKVTKGRQKDKKQWTGGKDRRKKVRREKIQDRREKILVRGKILDRREKILDKGEDTGQKVEDSRQEGENSG
jgi:hypothetical protein